MNRLSPTSLALVLVLMIVLPKTSLSQSLTPRFGFGSEFLISTADNLGFGFRGRVSMPVNADFSVAIGAGISGFVLRGRDDAKWVFTPQVSGIVTLEGLRQAPYLLGGVGAYIPTGDPTSNRGGPTFHVGLGKVRLLNEASLFYEFDPAIIIAKSRVHIMLPVRVGIIF